MNDREYYKELANNEIDRAETERDDALCLVRDLRDELDNVREQVVMMRLVLMQVAAAFEELRFPKTTTWLREFLKENAGSGERPLDSGKP